MHGPIIVCGLGQVGYRVACLLLEMGEPFVVVTDNIRAEWRRNMVENGVLIFDGDARDEELLVRAGLQEARALLAVTSSDLTNIEIALDAKRHRPDLTIVARMFDQNLAQQLANTLGIERALAMSMVAAPAFASAAFGDHVAAEFDMEGQRLMVFRIDVQPGEAIEGKPLSHLADEFGVGILLYVPTGGELIVDPPLDLVIQGGDVVKVIGAAASIKRLRPEFTQSTRFSEDLAVVKRSVNPFAFLGFIRRLWKNTSRELRAALLSIVLLTTVSVFIFSAGLNITLLDALYFVVTTVTTTGYGDITPKDASTWLKLYTCLMMVLGSATVAVLYSIVTDYVVTARLQQLVGRQDVPDSGHVIVAGLGDVGYRVVEELHRMGSKVVVIDLDGTGKYVGTIRNHIPVIVGDARDQETLRRAGAARAIAVIAATGDDAVNLSIGLASETINPESRSVLRLFDANFANKVQSVLSIDAAMSASRIAAPVFVSASLYEHSVTAFVLRGKFFSILRGKASGPGSWTLALQQNGGIRKGGSGVEIGVVVRDLKL